IAVVNGQIVLNGKPVPQDVEPPLQLSADPKLTCSDRKQTYHCYNDFMGYRTLLPSGREVLELPTLRETMPNGATYLIIKDRSDYLVDNYPETKVPEGHVFLMGDNRNHSADSRVSILADGLGGPVPLSDVGGRAEFVTFSLDGSQTWNPLTWWKALRSGRSWRSLRPARLTKDT
ncbi:MAG TPA: S26 family signal peptidase, partial [Novosphingobium sp.]|nr:S26 family signal peptidase [Novosphingobium sp.]